MKPSGSVVHLRPTSPCTRHDNKARLGVDKTITVDIVLSLSPGNAMIGSALGNHSILTFWEHVVHLAICSLKIAF